MFSEEEAYWNVKDTTNVLAGRSYQSEEEPYWNVKKEYLVVITGH